MQRYQVHALGTVLPPPEPANGLQPRMNSYSGRGRKVLYTLDINYHKEITALTYPLLERYAEKIGADFQIIQDRKFEGWPAVYEKFQIYELGKDNDWNLFIDADALVHPDFFDLTEHISKDTVLHNGHDMFETRFKPDRFTRRDGRHISSCTWFCLASDWCREFWKPLDDMTLEEARANIRPTVMEQKTVKSPGSLIDDYTFSRNIAKYGLKFKCTLKLLEEMNDKSEYLWHHYLIAKDEKIRQMKGKLRDWNLGPPVNVTTRNAMAIEGWLKIEEINWLATEAIDRHRIVEIGSHAGRSTRLFGDNTPGFVLAIDDWKGPRDVPGLPPEPWLEKFLKNVGDLIECGKVKYEQMDHARLPELGLDFTPDMVFVDGDHTYESVKRDLAWALSVSDEHTLICGHDFERPEVRHAVRDLLHDNGWQVISGIGLLWWAVRK
jgi:methyltransferase family protein